MRGLFSSVWVVVSEGDTGSEIQQLIEGYVQQAEQLRFSFCFVGCLARLSPNSTRPDTTQRTLSLMHFFPERFVVHNSSSRVEHVE